MSNGVDQRRARQFKESHQYTSLVVPIGLVLPGADCSKIHNYIAVVRNLCNWNFKIFQRNKKMEVSICRNDLTASYDSEECRKA